MLSFIITLKRLLGGLWHAFKKKNFQVLFVLIIFMLLSGTIFYVKEEGLSIVDALYFCVVTLSTVGHPSFEPQTSLGKVFTMVYIIAGTGLFLGLVAHIAYAIFQANDKKDADEA
ncbi:potassium channel family protein [Paenibacillus sp. IHBB 10380]|uniref:potassium channel family protein n=1 Tax=Paenibacillus sp. IHBB 10380 TaxID=1566358 RepID=UPI0005CF99EC|nr:potassium channel family protein [Paenibacillus sp. IHBB 10380]AJS60523.1 transporter [Paenibacillus sp. IHBB 10380]